MSNPRPLEAVFGDATALFADASALMRRARSIRLELEAAPAAGADETERLVHGATMAGIEAGLVQGLQAALRELMRARDATGEAPPAWLRKLLDEIGEEDRGRACAGSRSTAERSGRHGCLPGPAQETIRQSRSSGGGR